MESNLGTKVRGSGAGVLLTAFVSPWRAISNAIHSGHRLAYTRRGVLYPFGGYIPPQNRWAKEEKDNPREPKSLIPCMTAVAIEVMKLGGIGRRYKQTERKVTDA